VDVAEGTKIHDPNLTCHAAGRASRQLKVRRDA
jgi:hypothetical protein